MKIPIEIENAIKNNNLVIFAGSGLSSRFSLPSWKNMVIDLIKEINIEKFNPLIDLLETNVMDSLEVLNKLEEKNSIIRRYIKNNFKIKENVDISLHKKLMDLSGKIITTNYDNAFEFSTNYNISPTVYTSTFNISELNKSEGNYIFKLHGTYSEPDNCAIFQSDYDRLYSKDNSAIQKLKSIFTDKVILFIGFSLNDRELSYIFNDLDKLFSNNNKHFVITRNTNDFNNLNYIESIEITDFNEIDLFIDSCIEFKNKCSVSNIDLDYEKKVVINNRIENTPKRVAFLTPNPLDLDLQKEISKLHTNFDNLDIKLLIGSLNKKTLETLEDLDLDLVIIASKVFKSKIYIEEDNLKSTLLSIDELVSCLIDDSIPTLFITNEEINLSKYQNYANISSFKNSVIKKFIFKFLREGKVDFSESEIRLGTNFKLNNTLSKGTSIFSSLYGNDKDLEIGKKVLINIIGRVEEQAIISLKILDLNRTNKLLNIKASGGIGKTTIIKKVAYELYNRGYFKQGVTFNSLENVKNYDNFEDIVTRGFNFGDIIDFKDHLQENYNFSKLDLLVILDNFETVANTFNAEEFSKVVDLLKFITDYASIVITSREKIIDLSDCEDLYSLPPLVTDDAERLFIQYYGKIESTQERRILREEILEDLLNNNPLAIKLVTNTSIRYKYILELKEQLKNHFFESTNEDYSLVFKNNSDLNIERTKSIFQSINYSYTTLSTNEKFAFELLNLFPDGISLSNFKKCFDKKLIKNKFSDKDLRVLRDKSLIEDYNGTLQLQPIIRRFADFQFNKRDEKIKELFCSEAYTYNCFILDLTWYIKNKENLSTSLVFYNMYKNNLLKVLTYLPYIKIKDEKDPSNKTYFAAYIYELTHCIKNDKQLKEINELFDEIKIFFEYDKNLTIFISTLEKCLIYYHDEFDYSYEDLCEILNSDDMEGRVFKDEDVYKRIYNDNISTIHSMEGHTLKYINTFILNNDFSEDLENDFFYLGIPTKTYVESKGFYFFEYNLMHNKLNVKELKKYIKSLHQDLNIEIVQSTYTLSKVESITIDSIKKLVISNPYTKGLKHLMHAIETESSEDKNILFEKALKNLKHIKYYYLEALYYYCLFLKEYDYEKFERLVIEGKEYSLKYKYQYIYYIFKTINETNKVAYNFTYDFYENENLENYVIQYEREQQKRLNKIN